MLEGATAHHNGPPDLSQHFSLAVDVSSFLLFGPVYTVCSLYPHSLHCISQDGHATRQLLHTGPYPYASYPYS